MYMSKAIPLCAALSIHVVNIVIGEVLMQCFDLLLEYFATKCWLVGHIERQTSGISHTHVSHGNEAILHRHDLARSNLFRSCCNASWRKQIQSPNLSTL